MRSKHAPKLLPQDGMQVGAQVLSLFGKQFWVKNTRNNAARRRRTHIAKRSPKIWYVEKDTTMRTEEMTVSFYTTNHISHNRRHSRRHAFSWMQRRASRNATSPYWTRAGPRCHFLGLAASGHWADSSWPMR